MEVSKCEEKKGKREKKINVVQLNMIQHEREKEQIGRVCIQRGEYCTMWGGIIIIYYF